MARNRAKKNPPPRNGKALTLLRIGFNWEQALVAEATGRSVQGISDLERGHAELGEGELVEIVRALGAAPRHVAAALRFLDEIDDRSAAHELPEPAARR